MIFIIIVIMRQQVIDPIYYLSYLGCGYNSVGL